MIYNKKIFMYKCNIDIILYFMSWKDVVIKYNSNYYGDIGIIIKYIYN